VSIDAGIGRKPESSISSSKWCSVVHSASWARGSNILNIESVKTG